MSIRTLHDLEKWLDEQGWYVDLRLVVNDPKNPPPFTHDQLRLAVGRAIEKLVNAERKPKGKKAKR